MIDRIEFEVDGTTKGRLAKAIQRKIAAKEAEGYVFVSKWIHKEVGHHVAKVRMEKKDV